ncbi:hypothetical protein ACFP2F_20630 [Hymenobacter artigasi]|uniref:Uncharacterized protein n=1 Tax=Hymenobacter artigasi TaxID=2719616 RepID=A0ABX1HMT9_9BACT|nr:hypothetical protein [Hymenobacter artigasi]NKI91572.1 hypothetical protein [Hymenobacter artigasi]
MDTPNPEDKKGGRKRLSKAVYKRDKDAPDEAPKKPEELVHSKNFSIRFTQSEWESITTKASLGGVTPTAIVRAGALELKMQAVLSRVWTPEERVEYRHLVNSTNYYKQQSEREDLSPSERQKMDELYVEMRRLLAILVPVQIEQKEDES